MRRLGRATVALISILAVFLCAPSRVGAQSIDEAIAPLVEALAKQLVERKRPRVAAVDFTDIQGRPTELGRFLADHISVDMVMAPGITVLDRANLAAIMAEHKLTAAGLVDPETAKKLGKFAGVDAVIVGSLSVMETSVLATVRAISTETAELVAAGRMRFDLTDDARRMLGLSISSRGSTSAGPAEARTETPPLAEAVIIGPITAAVKNVSYGLSKEHDSWAGRQIVPQIRVTLELQNRHSNVAVAVAANSQIVQAEFVAAPTSGLIFGSLQDTSGGKWVIAPGHIRGISTLSCFETTGASPGMETPHRVTQNSPSNVVDYIRRGAEYTGGSLPNRTQRFWTGTFASIGPAATLEMTVVFVPASHVSISPRGLQWSAPQRARGQEEFRWPRSVEFSLELLVGTHQVGDTAGRSSDLALRHLVIARMQLPEPTAGSR
jgi:TolB-like protein